MKIPQFLYAEYERLLYRIAGSTESFSSCRPETITTIQHILYTDYPFREDDIEYLMDMTNYYMRLKEYTGRKNRFPVGRYLDQFCDNELYIDLVSEKKRE